MTAARMRAVVLAALLCGAAVVAVILSSDHLESRTVWAIFGPVVMWTFVGTGLYAWRRRPESRAGELMVVLGFAWSLSALTTSDLPLVYSAGHVVGTLWAGVFVHLVMTFPSGRFASERDRAIVIAGYLIFTVASVPIMFFAGPEELDCDDCPENVLLIEPDAGATDALSGVVAVLYLVLFAVVLVRLALRWRRTPPVERLQLTPVYVCGLLAFLLASAGNAGAGEGVRWAGLSAMALLPFAFLGGLLRSHVARLDAELRARLEELRASRARLVRAGDEERRRLERDLHDGAQSRLVALALLIRQARSRTDADSEAAALLDRAQSELETSLAELRELARGIHPALLTERGLEPALSTLASRAPVPVTVEADGDRLPGPVEIATYFVVSEALANVAKYAQASEAKVAVRREDGRVTVEVSDDGVGGADATRGSGLRGLADRVAALDGTLSLDSPAGEGTRLRVEIPCEAEAWDDRVVSAADRYASALADAIVASLRADPPPGMPARIVIRWFEGPRYLTIHALGTDEEDDVPPDDAWYPLEWPNEPTESERARAILEDAAVAEAAEPLAAELENGAWYWDEQPEALIAAAVKVRERLVAEGVALPDHFAVGVAHFEGWGPKESVPRANPRAVVKLLRRRGLHPGE